MTTEPSDLLAANAAWAAETTAHDPDFFARHAAGQSPPFLWIGCSDSRVPPTQIAGLGPGDLFVHRNIANQVVPSDINCLSALQYAVDVLQVRHVIVCGHDRCGGVAAAVDDTRVGLADEWIRHLRDLLWSHESSFDNLETDEKVRRLGELNVGVQVVHVGQTTTVQDAWARGQELTLHGWVYDLDNGRLRDLESTVWGPDGLQRMAARLERN